jgi:hypothetical protein
MSIYGFEFRVAATFEFDFTDKTEIRMQIRQFLAIRRNAVACHSPDRVGLDAAFSP